MNLKQAKAFYSQGSYSLQDDTFKLFTEIPIVQLSCSKGESYSLNHYNYYDISTGNIPCLLNVFKHGHPTYRLQLNAENLTWIADKHKLSSVFKNLNFTIDKILVITVHDEDFETSHCETYRNFIENNVTYDLHKKEYNFHPYKLELYLNDNIQITSNEEPRTVSGGTIDPA